MDIKRNIISFICVGFILGVFFSSLVKLNIYFLYFVLIVTTSLFVFVLLRRLINSKNSGATFILILMGMIAFLIGVSRFEYREAQLKDDPLSSYENEAVVMEGLVVEEPLRKDKQISFKTRIENVTYKDVTTNVSSYVLLQIPFYREIDYGDRIEIRGKVEAIKNFEVEGKNNFDYVSYLKKDKVNYQVRYPEIKTISTDGGNYFIARILLLKQIFISNISANLKEPDASLVSGMTIAGKQSLDKSLQEDFIKAGIIHIVVLSGYNISLIVAFFMNLFANFRKRVRNSLIFCGLFVFLVMTGFTTTVLRAVLMALIIIFAKSSGRTAGAGRVLLIAGFLMVLQNPYILVFDPSFALSFMATFAVIYIAPLIRKHILFVTDKFKIKDIVSETFGTQLFLLPFLVYKMGVFSIVALPVNLFVLPVVPAIMFFGSFVGFLGYFEYLAFPFSLLSSIFISYLLFIVNLFISLPFSYMTIQNFSLIFTLIIYGIYLLCLIYLLYFRKVLYFDASRSLK